MHIILYKVHTCTYVLHGWALQETEKGGRSAEEQEAQPTWRMRGCERMSKTRSAHPVILLSWLAADRVASFLARRSQLERLISQLEDIEGLKDELSPEEFEKEKQVLHCAFRASCSPDSAARIGHGTRDAGHNRSAE